MHHHEHHRRHYPGPVENIADIAVNLVGLTLLGLHGSARIIRSVYGNIVWGDHPGCHSCYECSHYCEMVECRPHRHNCHHCD